VQAKTAQLPLSQTLPRSQSVLVVQAGSLLQAASPDQSVKMTSANI
jgi:hypothetical protein